MTEKVIQEIKLIETDEGFRLEVKGDKEQLKQMGFGSGMFGFGRMMQGKPRGRRGRRHGHRHEHGPRGRRGRHMRKMWRHHAGERDTAEKMAKL